MAIEFVCNGCSNTLKVPDEHAGKHARCPQCSSVNAIPTGKQTPQQSEEPYKATTFGEFDPFQNVQTKNEPYANSNEPTENYSQATYDQQPPATGSQSPGAYGNTGYPKASYSSGYGSHSSLLPHRGAAILTLGLLAIFCNFLLIPGILAPILGFSDLSKINKGEMDPEGRPLAITGIILGIIGTLIMIGMVVLWIAAISFQLDSGF